MNKYYSQHFSGEIEIPASKSQTIRALLIATFAKGKSIIRHPLLSSDTLSCVKACESLGAIITYSPGNSIIYVDSTNALKDLDGIVIDCQNSGTTEYLLLPLLATLDFEVTLTGDEQLKKRPVGPLAKALSELGAKVETNNGFPPVKVKGPIKGGDITIECKTSQYLSGLLLATPLASSKTKITCSLLYEKPYVGLTLGWLKEQNIQLKISQDYEKSEILGGQTYKPFDAYINGDYSSASFFFALSAINRNSNITIKGLDKDDPQGDKDILDILEKMGAKITWVGNKVNIKGPEKLSGGTFDLNAIPDTLPILSIVAAFSPEKVKLTNVPQARIKETDRIASMRENLEILGLNVKEEPDGLIINGGKINGGLVKGFNDHRIIMALSILASSSKENIEIDDTSAVSVTFPTFFTLLESLRS